MVIYGFDENGNYLRKVEVDEITKNNENGTIKKYMDGKNVAYLELKWAVQVNQLMVFKLRCLKQT